MKIGDAVPPAITGSKPCPRCKNEVFKTYPTGFVDEINIVISVSSSGLLTLQEQWHCPGCGYREQHTHDTDADGLRVDKTESITIKESNTISQYTDSTDVISDSSTTTGTIHTHSNSSDKPKRKKKNYKT